MSNKKDNNKKHFNKEHKEEKNINSPKENKTNKEVEELKRSNEILMNEVTSLKKENELLKLQVQKWEKEFIEKINLKQKEANEIIHKKQEELTKLNETKLEEFKTKLFTKDILDLIATIEQFEKIISSPIQNEIVQNYVNGFRMFLNMFENSLSSMGIEKVQIKKGDLLDTNTMEAIELVENSDFDKDSVVEIVSNAYKYKNNVIKYAKVKIQK